MLRNYKGINFLVKTKTTMETNQGHKFLNLLNISYDNRSIIYIIETHVRRRKSACFFGFYSRTNSFSSFMPETIRIYRLHTWPEIKTRVFFRLLSSFLLPLFGYLKRCFHGIILRVFCIPFLVSWLYQSRRHYIRYS